MMCVILYYVHIVHAWLLCNSLLCVGVAFSPKGGGVANCIVGAWRKAFNSCNSKHKLVGCPDASHKAQSGGTLDEEVVKVSPLFPSLFSLLLASADVDACVALIALVSCWVGRRMMLIEVMADFFDMDYGARYQTRIMKSMFGNVKFSMNWWKTKLGGAYKKCVWVIAYGRNVYLVIAVLGISRTGSWV